MNSHSRVLETFIAVQYLLNGALLLPGTQPIRFIIRAAPYLLSLSLLLWSLGRKSKAPSPPGSIWMRLALLVLLLGLLHPDTQSVAGMAQLALQLAIVAPVFWAARLVTAEAALLRLLRFLFLCSAIGSVVGILQIYYPQTFLPAEFSSAAGASWLNSLTFKSSSGEFLVRPPGLTDLPGGAAVAASFAAILGLAFGASSRTRLWLRFAFLGGAGVGIAVLYLTQIRSLVVTTFLAILLLAAFSVCQRRAWSTGWLAGASVVLILGAFAWAVAIGGEAVRARFLEMADHGLAESFQSSRGWFWQYTFGEGVEQYPFGAGLGRWGMMNAYFAQPDNPGSQSLWAEIQLTGWLFDGGVALWILYCGGLITSMLFAARVACALSYGQAVPFAAACIFAMNCTVIGASFAGPAFNTSLGMQYWLLIATLYGAARAVWRGPSQRQIRFDFVARPLRAEVT